MKKLTHWRFVAIDG